METRNNLDTYTDAQADKARDTGRPVFLRRGMRSGWTGRLSLYLLHCGVCNRFTVTHPAGYNRRITCLHCRRTVRHLTISQRLLDKVRR